MRTNSTVRPGRGDIPISSSARVRLDTALAAKYCREAVGLLADARGTSSMGDANRMRR